MRKEKKKACAVDVSDNRHTERTPLKCFRCVSEDHLIAECLKPPKNNKKWRRQVHFNEKVNRARDNSKNNSDQNIYVSISYLQTDYLNLESSSGCGRNSERENTIQTK